MLERLVAEKEDKLKRLLLSLKELRRISKCSIWVRSQVEKICPKVRTLEIDRDWASKVSVLT